MNNVELGFQTVLEQLSGKGAGPLAHTDVKKFLRHTHPVLGVDQVVDHDFAQGWVHAVRAISCSQPVFEGHFPDAGIYPGTSLAQDTVQVAIVLFVGATGPLMGEGRDQEMTVVSKLEMELGHPVPPGTLLDIVVWRPGENNPKTIEFQFEARVRNFPYYSTQNRLGMTFNAAIRGGGKLNRVKRKIYSGIGF